MLKQSKKQSDFETAQLFKDRWLILITGLLFGIILAFNWIYNSEQHFSLLALSFLHGKNYFTMFPSHTLDTVYANGLYYWPLGPIPAIVLMPFVFVFNLFGRDFYQGYLQTVLVFATFYVVYKIAQKIGYSIKDSWYLGFAFVFSSVFFGIAVLPWSWFFSQVLATLLLFVILYEYLTTRRLFLIGLYLALIILTRTSASLFGMFIVAAIVFDSGKKIRSKFLSLFALIIPVLLGLLVWGIYNYSRFGNIFDQGYTSQILFSKAFIKARNYGLFSLVHLPGNLYYFLLSTPLPVFRDNISHVLKFPYIQANPWGMSIFVTSPYFVYLFFLKYKDKLSKILIATSILIAIPLFLYYGVGYWQLGYRYSLDFLPLVFLLLIKNYKQQKVVLSKSFKFVILFSGLINAFFIFFMVLFGAGL